MTHLFPFRLKKFGYLLLIPSSILGILLIFEKLNFVFFNTKVITLWQDGTYFKTIENNILDEIVGITFIIGAILVGFSKEKVEDEYIAKIRSESLIWTTYFNYLILIIGIVLFYDFEFFTVMKFNIFTALLFFIFRYQYLLNKARNEK